MTETAARSDAPFCNATALRKASRKLTQFFDEALSPSGLRSTQFAILAELERRSLQPPTIAELAAALVMDRTALSHTLRPLERDGLIALLEGVADRRQRQVALTSRGKSKYRDARQFWLIAQNKFNELFGESEAAALRSVLLKIAFDDRLVLSADDKPLP